MDELKKYMTNHLDEMNIDTPSLKVLQNVLEAIHREIPTVAGWIPFSEN